jgi:hypothetical protein
MSFLVWLFTPERAYEHPRMTFHDANKFSPMFSASLLSKRLSVSLHQPSRSCALPRRLNGRANIWRVSFLVRAPMLIPEW